MLRSLVGSEMCIRDSLTTARSASAPRDRDVDLGEGTGAVSSGMGPSPWTGTWETDIGVLALSQIDRQVQGRFDEARSGISLYGIVTTDPSTLVGEIRMVAGSGGFKVSLDEQGVFRGFWWWPDSSDKMPWSGKRGIAANLTAEFKGTVEVHGDVTSRGMLTGAAVRSSTMTSPSIQESQPYLLSAVSCNWRRTELDPTCGTADGKGAGSTWGGLANVNNVASTTDGLKVEFETVYAGDPICFVSFGGKHTKLDYSVDTHPEYAEIFLKKNGCCESTWKEFDGKFSLVCHGAAAQNIVPKPVPNM
eukprot:TRINITY_DN4853_c0_g1_i6.p1 TRINITY_DN4853_c0_g1~~TRINITY_DN4853_c0_g1_i6.p1  ORF type:complete len:328 (-),score=91.17 TRINITY_DN4853_c0_g1_i6:332-1246(-)